MKKLLVLSLVFLFGTMTFTSCKEHAKDHAKEHKEEVKKEHDSEKHDELAHATYQCPMDCESGKTYENEGKCPVCKMALKEKKEKDSDTHEDGEAQHDEGSEEEEHK